MQAGSLDSRVRLLRNFPKRDAANAPVDDWYDVTPAGVAAYYAPVSDGEAVRADQAQAAITDRFQIRWSSRVQEIEPITWRLVFDGRTYDIARVKFLGRRGRELVEISAKAQAVTPAGG